MNTQKSLEFLPTNNKKFEKEMKKRIFIYNAIKKNKIFRNKLNQKVKDLYTENCKTLLKKIREDIS